MRRFAPATISVAPVPPLASSWKKAIRRPSFYHPKVLHLQDLLQVGPLHGSRPSKTPSSSRVYNAAMTTPNDPIVLGPGEGRAYSYEAMRGVFKADGEETGDAYCVSEWSVAPFGEGPGPHSHASNVELFLVTEGVMSFLVGDDWISAPAGTFIRVPEGVTHDFANRGSEPATAFNVFIPGGFEATFASD